MTIPVTDNAETKVESNDETREIMPAEIREMFGIDNVRISELCKKADIKMKRNDRGLTYFTYEDVKKIKDVSSKVSSTSLMTVPDKLSSPVPADKDIDASLVRLTDMISGIESSITRKLSTVLDEKLDGMDDVVMELIKVKTENETMRFKINELNKEIYRLKKHVNSFKKLPFGFYAKSEVDKKFL